MRREMFGIMMILLLTDALVLALGVRLAQSEPIDIIVPDDYATIQKAINAANVGDRIGVRAGTYYENVVMNKTVSLVGQNRETTIIDGSGSGTVVYVTANNVNIGGFTIRNSGIPTGWPPTSGIILYHSDHSTITDCIIARNGGHGFCFVTSRYYTISNSVVSHNNYYGVAVGDTGSSNGVIRNNTVHSNRLSGIEAYAGSDNTIVEDNTVYSNSAGIVIGWSSQCMIRNNTLHNNTASILLDTASYCTVLNNRISHKQGIVLLGLGNYFNNILNNTVCCAECGISLGASAIYTTIIGNNISKNICGLIIAYNQGYPNYDNYIYHNDFVENTVNARDDEDRFTSVWDNGYPSGGNYWEDYTGSDALSGPSQNQTGSDGIGDTPYVIDVSNKDNYPLMKPNGWARDTTTIFSLTPNPVQIGRMVTLLGNLTDECQLPIKGVYADVYLNGTHVGLLQTDSAGRFHTEGELSSAGTYMVDVVFDGLGVFLPSNYTQALIVTQKVNTEISFSLSPNPAKLGQTIKLTGNLADEHDNPISNVPVRVYYSIDDGINWVYAGTLQTNSTGGFKGTGKLTIIGYFLIAVLYRGSYKYNLSHHIETLIINP